MNFGRDTAGLAPLEDEKHSSEHSLIMLYELIAVVRTGNLKYVKDIARTTGQQILQSRGVIRNITNWGVFDLPRPTVKYQAQHHKGHYFILQFDGSVATQQEVRRQLGLNPHMIRFSVVKIGDKLGGKKGSIENITGEIPWTSRNDNLLSEAASNNLARTQGFRGGKPREFS